jgi:hypothetical protein
MAVQKQNILLHKDEIRRELNVKRVKYSNKDTKDTLRALLRQNYKENPPL